jgi:cytochrome c oxidase subunit 3
MAGILLPPSIESEPGSSPSDHSRNGTGGGPDDPGHGRRTSELDPDRRTTALSASRMLLWLAIIWIGALFATLTLVLNFRWVHSKDWVSIPLPPVLYVMTAILLLSSLAIELARSSLRARKSSHCIRWIFVTVSMGLVFLFGQVIAWRELAFEGMHFASNPGSFFFYLITGAHALHLLGGITALVSVGFFVNQLKPGTQQQTALGTVALYWHFMDGLWLSLFVVLFMAIER